MYSFHSLFNIVPNDSPQNLISSPDKTYVTFSWLRPYTPNGIITQYNLTIFKHDRSMSIVTTLIITDDTNQLKTERVVSGFSPYQNYTASVSASTIIGAGPVATTTGRTLPDSEE